MATSCQFLNVGKEFRRPGKHMKNLKLYEAIGPARDAWIALNDKVTKYANDHHEEITRGVKRPEGYAISFFMVGSGPSTACPTILISSLNKLERRAAKRVILSLKELAVYPNIAVKCVDAKIAMLYADGDLPYDVPRNPACELFVEGGMAFCGARIVAGSSIATLGGVIYLNDGKTITPFGLTVFYAGSVVKEDYDIQPEDDVLEFSFDESSDEEVDEDLFENRSRSISMSQTDADIDKMTISRTLTESVDLEPKQDAEDSLQEFILPRLNITGDGEEKSKGRPPNGLDYQLVPLTGIEYVDNLLRIFLQTPIQPRFVAKEAKDVEVWAATSTTPPIRGRLSISPYLLKIPTYSLQKLWVVDLERDIRLGDSGAWIIDKASNVYGHIVAATPGSFRAYILPLYQIFEDIKVLTKCMPSLLCPSEIFTKATRIIQYGSGEEIPSGNESEKLKELPTQDPQNDAQKKWWTSTLPEILNTTEPAKVNNPTEERTPLSCPYLKVDLHERCFTSRHHRIRDVKQHIYRRHTPQFYCQRCLKIDFQDEESLQSHVVEGACHRGDPVAPFITLDQRKRLSRKSNPRLSEEDQWFEIWDILFPGVPRPVSAYMDVKQPLSAYMDVQQPLSAYMDTNRSGIIGELQEFQEYCLTYGPTVLTGQIESNLAWSSANTTTEQRQIFLKSVISRGINNLFKEFAQPIPSPNSMVENQRVSNSRKRRHKEETLGATSTSSIADSGVALESHRASYSRKRRHKEETLGATSTSSIADSGVAFESQLSSSASTPRRGSSDIPHSRLMLDYQMATTANQVEHTSTAQEFTAELEQIEDQNFLESEPLLDPYFDCPPFNTEWSPFSMSAPDFDSASALAKKEESKGEGI